MPERTHPVDWDDTLRRILTEPSTAARILIATADVLAGDPHLTVNQFARDYAATIAIQMITDGLPAIVADKAVDTAARALPAWCPGETCGEYAIRLRAAARTLR